MVEPASSQPRLFMMIAGSLISDIKSGKYPIDSKFLAERELAAVIDVGKPVIREAIIALETQGLVKVKVGSGVYVQGAPGQEMSHAYSVSAIEIIEAKLLTEVEVAALAATQITDDELAELDTLVERVEVRNQSDQGAANADRDFHTPISNSSINNSLMKIIQRFWQLRDGSPWPAFLYKVTRSANIKSLVDEHSAILKAHRRRDLSAARDAMRAHLSQALESMLFTTGERAAAMARWSVQLTRDRLVRATI